MTSAVVVFAPEERVRAWLQREYPRPRAKRIALDFKVDERTAKSWLSTGRMHGVFWHQMVARWGKRFLGFVYQDFDWGQQLALEAERERLELELAAIDRRMRGHTDDRTVDRTVRTVPHAEAARAGEVVERNRTRVRAGSLEHR